MPTLPTFIVKFWGTRGSHPQSGVDINYFGGKTCCISIECGDSLIVIDGGTGLIDLGDSLHTTQHKSIHVLLSHTHHDHIVGVPFFKPIWQPQSHIFFYCGTAHDYKGIEAVLETAFSPPYFPVPWSEFKARRTYTNFICGSSLELTPKINVDTIALNHPGGSSGFKIQYGNKNIVYLCDTDKSDFVAFCQNADLLIYDATFTCEEYLNHEDWGHSTWQEGVRLAQAANVKQLALFHHAPEHNDVFLKHQEQEAQHQFRESFFAYQGQVVRV